MRGRLGNVLPPAPEAGGPPGTLGCGTGPWLPGASSAGRAGRLAAGPPTSSDRVVGLTAPSPPTTGSPASAARPGHDSPTASGTCTCSPPNSPTSTGNTPRYGGVRVDPAVLVQPGRGRIPHRRRPRTRQTPRPASPPDPGGRRCTAARRSACRASARAHPGRARRIPPQPGHTPAGPVTGRGTGSAAAPYPGTARGQRGPSAPVGRLVAPGTNVLSRRDRPLMTAPTTRSVPAVAPGRPVRFAAPTPTPGPRGAPAVRSAPCARAAAAPARLPCPPCRARRRPSGRRRP